MRCWLERFFPILRHNRLAIEAAAKAKRRSRHERELATGALRTSLRKVLQCDPDGRQAVKRAR